MSRTASIRRARALGLVLPMAVLLALIAARPAAAQDPPALTGPVTDLVGAVEGSEARIEAAVADLQDATDAQLWVLYNDTTGSLSVTDYAEQVASDNDLGVGDALYVIALDDRTYALWLSDSLTDDVSVDAQDAILLDAEERLAGGDYAGAAIVVAEGLGEVLGGAAGPTPGAVTPTPGPGGDGGSDAGGGLSMLPVLGGLLILGGLGVVAWVVLSRRADARAAERRETLAKQANGLLLATDEAVKDAKQEVGFVEAMYGETEVTPYAQAIEQASAELDAAFHLRQRLDDAEPEDAPTEERMLREIVARTTRAQAVLATQQERIREMRALERDAPQLLEALGGQLAMLEGRLPAVARTRDSLEAFAASSWEPVRGNRTEAAKRVEFVSDEVAAGRAALEAGDTQRAAVAVRAASQAVAEAARLMDAVERAATELAAARDQVPIEIREAETDIAAARAAAAGAAMPGAAERLAQAEATLAEARSLATAVPPDVLGALQRANAAEAVADDLLAGIRRAEEARARQAAMLQGAIASAQARVELAAGFVATRRHGVGEPARVRAAEAQRHLEVARSLAPSDPSTALAEARRAEQLADEAYRLASADFGAWDQRSPTPPGWQGPTGGDVAGAILGGLIGAVLTGGRGPGPGWGGTPWGGSGGRGGGAPMPRLPRPSSRGGGWSGGGGRIGGGGRTRGGRW